jgi:membrane associated rhomboid family serine protease
MQFRTSLESPRQSPYSLTPWVKGIIAANVVVYFLTITVLPGRLVYDWLAFHPNQLGLRWWTFLTYLFVHGDFFHLLFNMLLLFFFGPALEERMRGSGFGLFYFTCGFGGSALSYLAAFYTPSPPIVGASGAVLGVALGFAINWPHAPIYVFPFPVPIKVKYLVGFLIAMDLLMVSAGAQTGTAHMAHLGGLLFGFIYIKSEERVMRRAKAVFYEQRARHSPGPPKRREWESHKEKEMVVAQSKQRETPNAKQEDRSVAIDRVLDKISQTGLESLTHEERKLLEEESRQLRKH